VNADSAILMDCTSYSASSERSLAEHIRLHRMLQGTWHHIRWGENNSTMVR